MTARELIMRGYIASEIRLQRGYVSRKTTLDTAQVRFAQGRRNGHIYVLWPHESSTQYCYRIYFTK